jgi:hypothetical protein
MFLFTWIGMLVTIFADIFRDHELSGWGKALWTLLLIVAPWLGALVYLIVRGHSINERVRSQAQRNEEAFGQTRHEADPHRTDRRITSHPDSTPASMKDQPEEQHRQRRRDGATRAPAHQPLEPGPLRSAQQARQRPVLRGEAALRSLEERAAAAA